MQTVEKKKPIRSVDLTPTELIALKAFRKKFETEVEAAVAIGMDRNTLNRIITVRSGSEKYINKIREALQLQTA